MSFSGRPPGRLFELNRTAVPVERNPEAVQDVPAKKRREREILPRGSGYLDLPLFDTRLALIISEEVFRLNDVQQGLSANAASPPVIRPGFRIVE